MPFVPRASWMILDGEKCWAIDWRAFFRERLQHLDSHLGGEMRGFHVVLTIRFNDSGTFMFWDDDGSIIRRNGLIIHTDRSAHALRKSELNIIPGDHVDIAQWQHFGGWIWSGLFVATSTLKKQGLAILGSYTRLVVERLKHPGGPPLKLYIHGRAPLRATLAIYSMVLNGYSPSEIILFGEGQWPMESRELFGSLLPFVCVVHDKSVIERLDEFKLPRLVELAKRYWFVMKACIALLHPPIEFCLMDDDVIILDQVQDALSAFEKADLVFAQDVDHTVAYEKAWGLPHADQALGERGKFNAGLYWARVLAEQRDLAARAMSLAPDHIPPFVWEQGFIADCFRSSCVHALPQQRFFYPLFDGLPGGYMGYDFRANPCCFASLHFGGAIKKPSERQVLILAQDILSRSHQHQVGESPRM